jgi:hypothetical protein
MKRTVKLIRNGTLVDEYKYKNVKDKKFDHCFKRQFIKDNYQFNTQSLLTKV